MNPGSWLIPILIAWIVITVIWLLLFIYRGLVSRKEEDQVFLDKGEERLVREQQSIAKKLDAVSPLLKISGILSLVLLLVLIALWIYQGLHTVNY